MDDFSRRTGMPGSYDPNDTAAHHILAHIAKAPSGATSKNIVKAVKAIKPALSEATIRSKISDFHRQGRLKRDRATKAYTVRPSLAEPTFTHDGATAAIRDGRLWYETKTASFWAGLPYDNKLGQIAPHCRPVLDKLEPTPNVEGLFSARQIEALLIKTELTDAIAPLRRFEEAWQAHCNRNLPAAPKAPDMTQPDTDQTGTAVVDTPFEHNGMSVVEHNGELYIRDIDVGTRLGMARPTNIRNKIKDQIEDYNVLGMVHQVRAPYTSANGRTEDTTVFYLNQSHVVFLTITARTEAARAARKEVIAVYLAWREGRVHERPSQVNPAPRQNVGAPLYQTIEAAMLKLKAAEERLAENRANMAADMDAIDAIKAELLKKLAA